MRELDGRPYTDIAELLGISVSALETLLFRARRTLREQLEEQLTCREAAFAISKQLDGALSLSDRLGLRAHLRGCPECAGRSQPPCAAQGAARDCSRSDCRGRSRPSSARGRAYSGRLNRRRLRSRGAGGEGRCARHGVRGHRRWCTSGLSNLAKARPVDPRRPVPPPRRAAHQDQPRRDTRRPPARRSARGVRRRPARRKRPSPVRPVGRARQTLPRLRPASLPPTRSAGIAARGAARCRCSRGWRHRCHEEGKREADSTGRRRRLPGRAVALRAPARAVAVWRRRTGSSSTDPRRRLRGRRRRWRRPPRRHPPRRLRRRRPRPGRRPRRRLRRRLRRLPGSPRRRPVRTRPLRAPRTAARIPSRYPDRGVPWSTAQVHPWPRIC